MKSSSHPSKKFCILILTLLAIGLCIPVSAATPDGASNDSEEVTSKATATLAMYCYWTGEATLGRVDGVLASRIGHWGGKEIVQVDYDPQRTSLDQLVSALKRQRSFDALVLESDESASVDGLSSRQIIRAQGAPDFIEPKHSLRTRYPDVWALDLDEQQAIALNSWSYFGGKMPDVLTDEQKRRLGR